MPADDDNIAEFRSLQISLPETKNSDERNRRKREGYLEWEDYFMVVAQAASMRSKDPSTQVGCVIVNKECKIVGTGYNGFPVGCDDDSLPWGKGNVDPLRNKHTYVVHAEVNAIINKIANNVEGCTLYTTLFPCNECAKIIIQSRLAEVVYMDDRPKGDWPFDASKKLLDMVGIPYRQFRTKRSVVTVKFNPACVE